MAAASSVSPITISCPPKSLIFNPSKKIGFRKSLKSDFFLSLSMFSLFTTNNSRKYGGSKTHYRIQNYGGSKTHYRRQNLSVRSVFTGIVEEMGEFKQLGVTDHGGFYLKICAKTVLEGVKLGDSISVNGTYLTVTEFTSEEFTVGLSPETLRETSLEELEVGSPVNLERAIQPASQMVGHFVQGYMDGTGEIASMEVEGDSLWVKVKADKGLMRYIVPKGCIAVDRTSLTVVDVFDEESCFNFMLVAYTQQKVVILRKKVGQKVNLEVDSVAKYAERLLSSGVFLHDMASGKL